MRRWLFRIISLASLLLCIITSVLWARSYNVSYSVWRESFDGSTRAERMEGVSLASGRIVFSFARYYVPPDGPERLPWPEGWQLRREPYYFAFRQSQKIGWLLWRVDRTTTPAPPSFGRSEGWAIGFNLAGVILLTAIAPTAWRVRFLRDKRRRRARLCVVCGYDLRATPERCPECGVGNDE